MSTPTGKSSAGYHRLESLMVCPRRFGYREIEKLVPRVMPKPLALGTCVHEGLAAFYLGRDPLAALRDVPDGAAWCIPKAKPMLRAYVAQRRHERVNVLAVEKEFGIEVNGHTFTRRIDLVVAENGRVVVRDHKTSGDRAKRQASFPFDASLFTQRIVGREVLPDLYGLPWGGVQVNLISTREPYTAVYHPVSWEPNIVGYEALDANNRRRDRARDDIGYWLRVAAAWEARGCSGWELPRSWRCQGTYAVCEYLPLCLRGEVELGGFVREGL